MWSAYVYQMGLIGGTWESPGHWYLTPHLATLPPSSVSRVCSPHPHLTLSLTLILFHSFFTPFSYYLDTSPSLSHSSRYKYIHSYTHTDKWANTHTRDTYIYTYKQTRKVNEQTYKHTHTEERGAGTRGKGVRGRVWGRGKGKGVSPSPISLPSLHVTSTTSPTVTPSPTHSLLHDSQGMS